MIGPIKPKGRAAASAVSQARGTRQVINPRKDALKPTCADVPTPQK